MTQEETFFYHLLRTYLVLERLPFFAEVRDHVWVGRLMEDIRVCPRAIFHYRHHHCIAVAFTSPVHSSNQHIPNSTSSSCVLLPFDKMPQEIKRSRVEGEQRRHSESETSEPNHAEPKQTRRIDSCCSLLVASLLKSQISSRAVWLTC